MRHGDSSEMSFAPNYLYIYVCVCVYVNTPTNALFLYTHIFNRLYFIITFVQLLVAYCGIHNTSEFQPQTIISDQ